MLKPTLDRQDVLLGLSFMYLTSGLSFSRMRRTCCTMSGFCHLYLLMILLMRSGDVETNPGPDRIISEEEFIKLSKLIKTSYYTELGVHLKISVAELGQIKECQNTSDALMTVFTRWRDKQPSGTDIRALLAEGLERIDLEYLSGKLLTGSLVLKRTDQTTSFPSSPNTSTSTTPTTDAAAATTTTQKAFLVIITLLTWAAVSVARTTSELSTTTGDTVNIPCLFGEGTLSNIFWYYNGGTGPQKILVLANGDITIEAEYANRTSLQDNYSMLILKDITVADEGTYRCDVDRQGQTVVTNINTKLNVFSLRPDTLPVISPCTGAGKSSFCSIHANQSFTLTCTLPKVYPVEDTELIWYQDGKRVSSTHDATQNVDGTTDISRQIRVPETGNFTCNATYLSANGRENTAVSVEAWIIPPADVPNTPGKDMTSSPIVWKTISIVLLVCISLVIIALFLYHLKARGQRSSRKHKNKLDEAKLNQVTSTDESKLLETSAGNGSKDENGESSKPTERPTEIRSEHEEGESSKPTERPTEIRSEHEEGITVQSKANEELFSATHNSDSTTLERIPTSTDGYPRHIRARDLTLLSPWWIMAKINKYFVGMRVTCTPYVRPPVQKGFTHIVLLYIHYDTPDVIEKTNKEMKEYRKLYPPQQMLVERRLGDISIELFDGPRENEEKIYEKILSKRDINLVDRKLFSFEVKPLKSGASQKFLKFTLDQKESTSYPTVIQFTLSYDAETSKRTGQAAANHSRNEKEELQGASASHVLQTSHRITDETLVNISGRQEDFDKKLKSLLETSSLKI